MSQQILLSRFFLILGLLILIVSCSKDDNTSNPEEPVETTITTSDLEITMDEFPERGQVIGTVLGSSDQGAVSFSIIEQSAEDAFSIGETDGVLKVEKLELFNYVMNPVLTGKIKVAYGSVFEVSNVEITLNKIERDKWHEGDAILTTQEKVNDFGFGAYTHINGDLVIGSISYNDIDDLTPLQRLQEVVGWVDIGLCDDLKTTEGLENIAKCEVLSIGENQNLESITGFQNLETLQTLNLRHNPKLSDISGLNQLKEINEFLYIINTHLEDLNSLSNLNILKTHLEINNNSVLKNVDGLLSINSTVETLLINNNPALEQIDGLANIGVRLNVVINRNEALQNVDGLSSVTELLTNITIEANMALENLHGLSNLKKLSYSGMDLKNNNSLVNLNGLEGLTEFNGRMAIEDNSMLRDFCAMSDWAGNLYTLSTRGNYYNPTIEDILNGDCSI